MSTKVRNIGKFKKNLNSRLFTLTRKIGSRIAARSHLGRKLQPVCGRMQREVAIQTVRLW